MPKRYIGALRVATSIEGAAAFAGIALPGVRDRGGHGRAAGVKQREEPWVRPCVGIGTGALRWPRNPATNAPPTDSRQGQLPAGWATPSPRVYRLLAAGRCWWGRVHGGSPSKPPQLNAKGHLLVPRLRHALVRGTTGVPGGVPRLRFRSLRIDSEVRQRNRLAELLGALGESRWHGEGLVAGYGTGGGSLPPLRRPCRPQVRRRTEGHGASPLYERRRAEVQAARRLTGVRPCCCSSWRISAVC